MSRPAYYKGFYIHQFGELFPYHLIMREGENDWLQIPFESVDEAKECIDQMVGTGKQAWCENGRIIYR